MQNGTSSVGMLGTACTKLMEMEIKTKHKIMEIRYLVSKVKHTE